MTEQPPPPPPPPLNEEREAVPDAPKKPWSKPTVLRITDATLETGSGPQLTTDPEGPTYRPS